MGVPEELLRLADQIFEALPEGAYQNWPERFAQALPVGADLGGVRAVFLKWLLFDPRWGLCALAPLGNFDSIFRDIRSYFDWEAQGLLLSRPLERILQEEVDDLLLQFKAWRDWDIFLRPEVRASRALAKVWAARKGTPQSLAEAAWICRAAWVANEAFAPAAAAALLEMLRRCPVLVEA
jgi:hypothetical protein